MGRTKGRYGTCDRCGVATRVTIMSRFDTAILCPPCERDERAAPGYQAAHAAEEAALMAGDTNYPGAGLTAADAAFLAARRAARAAVPS